MSELKFIRVEFYIEYGSWSDIQILKNIVSFSVGENGADYSALPAARRAKFSNNFNKYKTKSPHWLCASAGMLICALPHLRICPFGDLGALVILRGGWFAVQDIISGFLRFCGGFENKFAVGLQNL